MRAGAGGQSPPPVEPPRALVHTVRMDLFEDDGPEAGDNAHEFTVSEISGAVKKTIEGEFGHVRVRGEVGVVGLAPAAVRRTRAQPARATGSLVGGRPADPDGDEAAEAAARFDPETTEMEEVDTRAALHVHLDLSTARTIGTASGVHLSGLLHRADAEELEHAIRTIADQLLAAGSTDTLNVRRAKALGYLSRGDLTLDLDTSPAEPGGRAATSASEERASRPPRNPRQVVLHLHLSEAALHGNEGPGTPEVDPDTGMLGLHLARVENHHQTLTADAVRDWLTVPGAQITVKPVIDLADQIAVDSYEIPDRISQRVKLKRTTCVFPHCTRTSARVDLDHIEEYVPPDQGGPPGQTATDTLAPLCRRHHRAKTHPSPVSTSSTTARWDYHKLTPTTWLWTSPHGLRFLVHPDGTTEL